jgi:hypothetical protein
MVDLYEHLYKIEKVNSWKQLQHVSKGRGLGNLVPKEWNRWIFKGHESTKWELSTTLERTIRERCLRLRDAWSWERRLSREFMRKARGFLPHPPSDTEYMEWLALMQHYGAPTRLHDWTYSFWAAVLFAVEKAEIDKRKSCAVWALQIDWWRDECMAYHVPELKKMLKKGSNLKKEVKFILNGQGKPKPPSGIWPLNAYRLNERVVAQQALFVVPLDVTKSFMENLRLCSERQKMISRHLIKFVIPCSNEIISECVNYLYDRNLTSATLFPGIDGYAHSLGNLVLLPHRFLGIGDDRKRPWPN